MQAVHQYYATHHGQPQNDPNDIVNTVIDLKDALQVSFPIQPDEILKGEVAAAVNSLETVCQHLDTNTDESLNNALHKFQCGITHINRRSTTSPYLSEFCSFLHQHLVFLSKQIEEELKKRQEAIEAQMKEERERQNEKFRKEMEAEKEFLEREPKNDYERVLQKIRRQYWEAKFKPYTMNPSRTRTHSPPPLPASALTPVPAPPSPPSPPSPPARTSPLPPDYVSEDDPFPGSSDADLYDFL